MKSIEKELEEYDSLYAKVLESWDVAIAEADAEDARRKERERKEARASKRRGNRGP